MVLYCSCLVNQFLYRLHKMLTLSTNERLAFERKLEVEKGDVKQTPVELLDEVYELQKCSNWIGKNKFEKVCLQFPDGLLGDSVKIVLKLKQKVNGHIYILGDTSYGSCCVDEVAAQHITADCIIHFGHACLSPTNRLPVLYIFSKQMLNVSHFVASFKDLFPEESTNILLLYDVSFISYIDEISNICSSVYHNLVVSKLNINQECISKNDVSRLGRLYTLPNGSTESDYQIVFIGSDGRTLANFVLVFSDTTFYIYDPSTHQSLTRYEARNSKFMMRRHYLVEIVKDSKTLGIVIGTLGVSNYLEIVDRIKHLAKKRGKKCYIFSVGKLNVAKLANYPEVDAFVLVACSENCLLDSKEFFRPVVTPYEVELACNPDHPWSAKYIVDFQELLPGGSNFQEINEQPKEIEGDVSLITGQLRHMVPITSSCQCEQQSCNQPSDIVALKGTNTVSNQFSTGGGFLLSRSWQGLEQTLCETPVELAKQGRRGIAQNYTCELDSLNEK